MNVRYENSAGNSVSFTGEFTAVTSGYLHGRKWKTKTTSLTIGEKLEYVTKEALEVTLELTVRGTSYERKTMLDEITDCFEYDVVNGKLGKLYYGEWYCECIVIESTMKEASIYPTWQPQNIKVFIPSATWWSEELYSFRPMESVSTQSDDDPVAYPTDYPFTYPIESKPIRFNSDHYTDCDFVATIYGPTTSVEFYINGVKHSVNYPLESNQYMVIDTRDSKSANERCYVVTGGNSVNVYNYRNCDTLFSKIKPGENLLSYSQDYGIDITLMKGRSEPKWQQ